MPRAMNPALSHDLFGAVNYSQPVLPLPKGPNMISEGIASDLELFSQQSLDEVARGVDRSPKDLAQRLGEFHTDILLRSA